MNEFLGIYYERISKRLQKKVADLLMLKGEVPNNYKFVNGFVITPVAAEIGQTVFSNQVVSVGLVNKKTHEIKYLAVDSLLREIIEEEKKFTENAERCSVTNLWDYKHTKEDAKGEDVVNNNTEK